MSKILRDAFLKNRIGVYNIIKSGIKVEKDVPKRKYEISIDFRTEAYTERSYTKINSKAYIQHDKLRFDVNKVLLTYEANPSNKETHKYNNFSHYNDFVNDVLFLNDWGVEFKLNKDEKVFIEDIKKNRENIKLVC
jgi:hypothetical protein